MADPVVAMMDVLLKADRKYPMSPCPALNKDQLASFATRMRMLTDGSLVAYLSRAAVNDIKKFQDRTNSGE